MGLATIVSLVVVITVAVLAVLGYLADATVPENDEERPPETVAAGRRPF